MKQGPPDMLRWCWPGNFTKKQRIRAWFFCFKYIFHLLDNIHYTSKILLKKECDLSQIQCDFKKLALCLIQCVDCINFITKKDFLENSSLQKWKSIFASTNVKNCCFHAFWKCVMFTMLNAKEKTSKISLFLQEPQNSSFSLPPIRTNTLLVKLL